MDDPKTLIQALRMDYAVMKQRIDDHDRRQDEFMLRTDKRFEEMLDSVHELVVHSLEVKLQMREWTGIRKTLYALASVIVVVGGFIGWALHWIWTGKP